MKPRTRHYRGMLVSLGTLLAGVLVACQQAPQPLATPPAVVPQPTVQLGQSLFTIVPATAVTFEDFDKVFIDMMVPHRAGAIEMARIAQQRAERPEIKQLADDILRTHDAEISKMRQWRQQWYGSRETPPMSKVPMLSTAPGMSGSDHTIDIAADVKRLRIAPEPFDTAFIDAMIPHHESAIDAARVALRQSKRPELSDMALTILEAQQREVGLMRGWLVAWGPSWYASPVHEHLASNRRDARYGQRSGLAHAGDT